MSNETEKERYERQQLERQELDKRQEDEKHKLWLDHYAEIMGSTAGKTEQTPEMIARFKKDNENINAKHDAEMAQLIESQEPKQKEIAIDEPEDDLKLTQEEKDMIQKMRKMEELENNKAKITEKDKDKDDWEM